MWCSATRATPRSPARRGAQLEFPPNAAFSNEVKERWLSTFRGRVGYDPEQLAVLRHCRRRAGQYRAHHHRAAAAQISEKHWHWGWTAGGGVEVKISPDWSAKVEYLYVGLQDKSYFNPAPSVAFPSNQRVHLDDHIVRVGVNYKLPWNVLDTFFKR